MNTGRKGTGEAPEDAAAAGLLPSQALRAMVESEAIRASGPIDEDQIQPASLDLRLAHVAYRVRASFLPGPGAAVAERLKSFSMHTIDLARSAVLERGCVYIVPLQERLTLPASLAALANPKSSIGRLDVFTRLITDGAVEFDQVGAGYRGPLYAEISPRTFSIVVREGSRLNQLRVRRGPPPAGNEALRDVQRTVGLVGGAGQCTDDDIDDGFPVTVDLDGRGGPVGWRARQHAGLIDLAHTNTYDAAEFWEPVTADASGVVVLNPGDFYILASKETVTVPPDHAAEMRPYDTRVGEFRVHYAGFFDPGFGWADSGGEGSRAVLEIRSFEVPFALRHGQRVGRLFYEPLGATADKLYGRIIGSSYQRQGLMLAKQFRAT